MKTDTRAKQPMVWLNPEPGLLVLQGAEETIQIRHKPDGNEKGQYEVKKGPDTYRANNLGYEQRECENYFEDLRKMGVL